MLDLSFMYGIGNLLLDLSMYMYLYFVKMWSIPLVCHVVATLMPGVCNCCMEYGS